MDRRWRSWTSPLAWVLIGACAVLVASSGLVTRISSGEIGYLAPVPPGLSLAVLAAAALHSVGNPGAKDRAAQGIVGAVVLVAALVINVANAASSNADQVTNGVWASVALAAVELAAAVGIVLVTMVWFRGPEAANPGSQTAALPPRHQPSWSADQAVGASWTRAGDAATGAPAASASGTGWGVPSPADGPASTPAITQPEQETGIARPVPGVPTAADWASGPTSTPPAPVQPPESTQPNSPGPNSPGPNSPGPNSTGSD